MAAKKAAEEGGAMASMTVRTCSFFMPDASSTSTASACGSFFKRSIVRTPWSLKALAKFKQAETVPTPSAFSDCDRARISWSSAAAEETATGAKAMTTAAEEEAGKEEGVVEE
jgi:hypothetical protein